MMKSLFLSLLLLVPGLAAAESTLPNPQVVIKTSEGDITVRLFRDKSPVTVENFLSYVDSGYYSGTIFHRVIPDFMIQGGDPLGQGTGGPGYKFADEFHPSLKHDKPGRLSMANSGRNTNGSQFFLTEKPTPHLDNRHSIFGQVTEKGEHDAVFFLHRVTVDLGTPRRLFAVQRRNRNAFAVAGETPAVIWAFDATVHDFAFA